MKIQEFRDGYCLTHNDIEYKWKGKSKSIIDEISKKVSELLSLDLSALHKKIEDGRY